MVRVVAAFGVTLLVASPAFAETAPSNYTLSWVRAEGAEACPTARTLATEVERRLGRAVFDVHASRGFEVEVTRFGEKYRSDLFVRGPTGELLGHRTLESDEPGCGALVNATALAIALVIDPEAASREPPPAPSAATFEPPAVAPATAPPPPPPPAVLPPPAPPAAPPTVVSPEPRASVALSLRGSVELRLVPETAPGLGLAFAVVPRAGRRWGFALQATYTPPGSATRGIGSLEIGLTRAALLATFDLWRSERARWALAAGPSGGALHVAVREPTPVTNPGDYGFLAAQAGTVLQLHVSHGVFVELGAEALTPILRQELLVRRQAEPVWSQPRLAASLFGGVGAHFP